MNWKINLTCLLLINLLLKIKSNESFAEVEETNSGNENIEANDDIEINELKKEIGLEPREAKNITKNEFKELLLKNFNKESYSPSEENNERSQLENSYYNRIVDKIIEKAPEIISTDDFEKYLSSENLSEIFLQLDIDSNNNFSKTDDGIQLEDIDKNNDNNFKGNKNKSEDNEGDGSESTGDSEYDPLDPLETHSTNTETEENENINKIEIEAGDVKSEL